MMKHLTSAAVAALAMGALALASPASATLTKFAAVTSTDSKGDLQFSSTSHTVGSMTTYTSTLSQIDSTKEPYAAVTFSFDSTALVGLGNLAGGLTFSGTTTATDQIENGFVTEVGQSLMAGSFEVVYEGPTETYHTLTLTKGVTVLLQGVFNGGAIIADNNTATGGFSLDSASMALNGGTLTYTSDLESFLPTPTENTVGLTASSLLPGYLFKYVAGKPMKAFKGSFDGNFSSDPGPTASIPEPASWALMIAGMGLVGGAMRRRVIPARA